MEILKDDNSPCLFWTLILILFPSLINEWLFNVSETLQRDVIMDVSPRIGVRFTHFAIGLRSTEQFFPDLNGHSFKAANRVAFGKMQTKRQTQTKCWWRGVQKQNTKKTSALKPSPVRSLFLSTLFAVFCFDSPECPGQFTVHVY